ncbi:MAG TPA: S9 family peptidase [Gemmatimonadaceae bacterium]|nr:S9 family peptidase [Gemmatimonadaceae bacterium]
MRLPTRFLLAIAIAPAMAVPLALPAQGRAIQPGDIFRFRDVGEARISPDGAWVAYTLTTTDSVKDKSDSDVWMVSWDGTRTVRLTNSPEGEGAPRWSPDNRYLAFVSGRYEGKGGQVWLLDRAGGEGVRLTDFKDGVSEYAWSPDGTRLVVVSRDPVPEDEKKDSAAARSPKPIVIDRYHFKEDREGYLERRRSHLYVVDVASRKVEQVTSGDFDDASPRWSPDGTRLAFVSRRGSDADRENNSDIFVVEARAGATPVRLTSWPGPDDTPEWSPDGTQIAYLQGSEPRLYAYNQDALAVIPSTGGTPRLLAPALDRDVSRPMWAHDGQSIWALVTDDRAQHLARIAVGSGAVTRVVEGRRVVSAFDMSGDGRMVARVASATQPYEAFAVEAGALRALTHANDSLVRDLRLGTTEDLSFRNKDGLTVGALLVKPADYTPGRRYPLVLRIHGGPNGQDQHAFSLERELFAARGYVVLAVNYRGSSGRGQAWKKAIFADWGNKEVQDLLAGVDHVIAAGIADPDRLAIGGWSYGGILTNYTIATTPRFRAATSGAGSSLQTSMYGSDQYTFQYEAELGAPWKNPKAWEKVSYPFYHADRIRTPTLFLGGEKDFNVPIAGSEQMYQALKSLGVDAQLIVYPGQFHGITRPSFVLDRYQRYLGWYEKYLRPPTP